MRENPYDPKKQKVDIILCALRKDATKINSDELKSFVGQEHKYVQNSAFQSLRKVNTVILKVGAPVIFTKSHVWLTADAKQNKRKVVNGTRGHVEQCDADSIIVCLLNTKVKVRVQKIESDDKGSQFPIQLGWATTIKKAAGMTFDNVAINFGLDWSENEEKLIQCANRPWRTSQAYGAITRSRNLAFFCDAHLFTDAVMMALLNNQNHSALEFLKGLNASQDHFVRSLQNLRDLSTENISENHCKKRRLQTCSLLPMTAIESSIPVTDHVYANQWPQTLARQQAGYFCTGVLTSNGSKVIIKTSTQLHLQTDEIHALQCLSGITGVPKLIGKAGAQLVISSSGAKPHCGLLMPEHLVDLQRIINEMHAKGWTFKYITPQNVWTFDNTVILFNFENAVLISKANTELITINDFIQAFKIGFGYCGMKRHVDSWQECSQILEPNEQQVLQTKWAPEGKIASECLEDGHSSKSNCQSSVSSLRSESIRTLLLATKKKYVSCAALSERSQPLLSESAKKISEVTTYSAIIQREIFFKEFTDTQYSRCVKTWVCKSDVKKIALVSGLWTETENHLLPTIGPCTSWDAGLPYRDPRGYGTGTSELCLFLANLHQKYNTIFPSRPTIQQTFVDIGSGICNMVLQMSVLKHDFHMCFGIEILPFRAKFAHSACTIFASKAVASSVPFCKNIRAETGDACVSMHSKEALKGAGLIWINNELFGEKANMKIFELLNSLVPLGCVIITFQELLKTKRTDSLVLQSSTPCDFTVREQESLNNSCSWCKGEKTIFILQRTSRLYYKKQHFQ